MLLSVNNTYIYKNFLTLLCDKRRFLFQKSLNPDFLSAKEKQLLQGKSFPVSLYKALLFQKIAGGIKSGTLNFTNSNKYRSLEDYLIPVGE